MASWKTHEEWAKRFLEWGDLSYSTEELEALIGFPEKKDFIFSDHDYNRRTWRDHGNRVTIYNSFGRRGLELMDLHYCLDFLKEETDPENIEQRWKGAFPVIGNKYKAWTYPSVVNLARYLAIKTRGLKISRKVFKFTIVNFREILARLTSEHGYEFDRLRDWSDESFNRIMDELKALN